MGRVPVNVTVGSKTCRLNLYILDCSYDSLFGRSWAAHFLDDIDFKKLYSFSDDHKSSALSTTNAVLSTDQICSLVKLLSRYNEVFSDTAGKLTGPPVKVHLKPDARPVFAKAHDIPYAIRKADKEEIDSKIESGFYEKVEASEWASPTHIVPKKNGRIRITGNYKPTVNHQMIIDEHPIPKTEHIFSDMKGAKFFCHLDLTDAYTHLPVDE